MNSLHCYWGFIGFSKFAESELNIQNGGLHWLVRSQNFNFRMAITLHPSFIELCMADCTVKKRTCVLDSLVFNVALQTIEQKF